MLQLSQGLKPVPDPFSKAEMEAAREQVEWKHALQGSTYPASQLAGVNIPPREAVLGTWFLEGDLGFIYGPRGLGKTWLAMHIARKIAEGGRVASWQAPRPRQVLYIDGEMALDALVKRDRLLTSCETTKMFYIQHEALFHNFGKVLNLADPKIQQLISDWCAEMRVEVLFRDNLSCLFAGVKENDADSWEKVLPWLMDLRRKRLALVFVAHAGRNGCMRGTSRREDAAVWILQLTQANSGEIPENGARFLCRFDKNRNATEGECPPIEWTFGRVSESSIEIKWEPVTGLEKFRHWIEAGLTSATDIALEMKISKGQVSKLAKLAMEQGWLRRNGREYEFVTPRPPTTFSAEEAHEIAWGRSNRAASCS
jgi:hypothetical protein